MIVRKGKIMFFNSKANKILEQVAHDNVQESFDKVNRIMHHYEEGLSMFEILSYYTLCIAYGIVSGRYSDSKRALKIYRTDIYFSGINNGGSASRGFFGIQYDGMLEDHLKKLKTIFNPTNIFDMVTLRDIIKDIIIKNNEIFPEVQRSYDNGELSFIEEIIKDFND